MRPQTRRSSTSATASSTAGDARSGGLRQAAGERLPKRRPTGKPTCTFHAVTVGMSASRPCSRPSPRSAAARSGEISGEQTPQAVALELLGEIAQPGLRDLKVEFRGLKRPPSIPNGCRIVAAGTQQIILGRYLPDGEDPDNGEIVVTGTRGGKPVRYRRQVRSATPSRAIRSSRGSGPDALDTCSPRASHGDPRRDHRPVGRVPHHHALHVAVGVGDRRRSRAVRRQAAVPDARRREVLRPGRDNANWELVQQQMKRAADWRMGLRRQVLASCTHQGRDSRMFSDKARCWSIRRRPREPGRLRFL